MRRSASFLFLLLVSTLMSQAWAYSSLPSLIKKTKPAACTVTVYDEYWKIINQGSAFFFSPNLILSARHVFWKADMRNACFAKVTTYGKSTTDFSVLSVIIDDADSDLIILSVEGIGAHHRLTVSTDELLEGEDIFVISSPLGLPGVTSTGIISAIHNDYDIQISAHISEGSSGAPILNYNGEVVGVVSGYFTKGQNINFGVSPSAIHMLFFNMRQKEIQRLKSLNSPIPEEAEEDTRDLSREGLNKSIEVALEQTMRPGLCTLEKEDKNDPQAEGAYSYNAEAETRATNNESASTFSEEDEERRSEPINYQRLLPPSGEENKFSYPYYLTYEGYPSLREWASALTLTHEMSPVRPERLATQKSPSSSISTFANPHHNTHNNPPINGRNNGSKVEVTSSFYNLLHRISNFTHDLWSTVLNKTNPQNIITATANRNVDHNAANADKCEEEGLLNCALSEDKLEAYKTPLGKPPKKQTRQAGLGEGKNSISPSLPPRTEQMYKFFEKHKKLSQKP